MHRPTRNKRHRTLRVLSAFLLAGFCLQAGSTLLAQQLETLAVVDEAPGNITVTQDGSVVFTIHPALPSQHVALQVKDGAVSAFPDARHGAREAADSLGPMLGLRADREDRVWLLSSGGAVRVHVWNLATQMLERSYEFPDRRGGFNDLALALSHGKVILSDQGNSALAVLDVQSGDLTLRLAGHSSMQAEDITASIDGKVLGNAGQPLRDGLNPLTIDSAEEWVYYGAMSGTAVYRVRVADLLDTDMDEVTLATRVERYADKPASAGITIDDAGNVYVTDIQAHGIGVAAPGQPYRLLVSDPVRLAWADGISVGPDGYIYTANNQLFRNFGSHRDNGPPAPPFYVTRVKALAATTVGR